MSHPHPQPDQGFTLIELLVVISIIAILAGMLIPTLSIVREQARLTNCGKNQAQIVTAMLTYGNENSGQWPYAKGADVTYGTIVNPTALTDKASSVASMELLASWSDGELVPKLFACPANPIVVPPTAVKDMDSGGLITGGWTVGTMAYAYDPSIPIKAKATRAVLADRPISATESNHKKLVAVVFGDGHVGNAKLKPGGATASGTATYYSDGTIGGSVTGVYTNPDTVMGTTDDNIFDNNGDNQAPTLQGRGSATRAWLR